MHTYTQRYERVTVTAQRRVTCPVCGKRRGIQRTFGQTVNPFNPAVKALVDAHDPAPAPYREAYQAAVWRSVSAEADGWVPARDESTHVKCWNEEQAEKQDRAVRS